MLHFEQSAWTLLLTLKHKYTNAFYSLNWLKCCLTVWLMKLVNMYQVPKGFLLTHLWVARFQRPQAYEAHWLTERTTETESAPLRLTSQGYRNQYIALTAKNKTNDNRPWKVFERLLVTANKCSTQTQYNQHPYCTSLRSTPGLSWSLGETRLTLFILGPVTRIWVSLSLTHCYCLPIMSVIIPDLTITLVNIT